MLSNTPYAHPGHALEAGWFLLQFASEDKELQKIAVDKFVELPYKRGWDSKHGGLFYFLDVDGLCPTQVSSPAPSLICSFYYVAATRKPSAPSAKKKKICFLGTAGVEHEAVVASLRGPDSLPDGLQTDQKAAAAGKILRGFPVHLQPRESAVEIIL